MGEDQKPRSLDEIEMGETKSVESARMDFALCERGGRFLLCHLGVMRERKESVLGLSVWR